MCFKRLFSEENQSFLLYDGLVSVFSGGFLQALPAGQLLTGGAVHAPVSCLDQKGAAPAAAHIGFARIAFQAVIFFLIVLYISFQTPAEIPDIEVVFAQKIEFRDNASGVFVLVDPAAALKTGSQKNFDDFLICVPGQGLSSAHPKKRRESIRNTAVSAFSEVPCIPDLK